jgi:hypothetical protein
MENFNKQNTKAYKKSKGSGTTYTGNTTGIGMGQQGYSNLYQNSKRQIRLEWRC